MRAGTVQGQSLGIVVVLAPALFAVAALAGYPSAGAAIGAGLLLGSANGFLIQSTFDRRAPILATSFVRLALFTGVAFGAAALTGMPIMPLVGGLALAQLVMVGVGVRQGIRR
ncbi:MAG TPA: hypothetical protein VFL27_01195 [Candidatus Dormibacteraeota bacterium]|nr:hypothetical protein [Candidatus Dormibacteraeota bacterium]